MDFMILPQPKEYCKKDGFFNLKNSIICVSDGLDMRVIKAALKIRGALLSKTGISCKFTRSNEIIDNSIHISKDSALKEEEYKLEISENNILIMGGSDKGCFYGIITLLQIIEKSNESKISALLVKDCPDMVHRGFYYDVTRGRVPSVDGLKDIVDKLAALKINSLQLYVEHTFDFEEFKTSMRTEDDYLTAEEILEIDEYCYNNFIDFIPSLSTFGHLYELLIKEEYSHLCELENYVPENHFWRERMAHHTIDPTNPESIKVVCSLIDQYLPLFRSKYFNICCDETFDLGKGRNSGTSSSELYIDFVKKVTKHITDAGKTAMMWGDIALAHPELLSQIPKETVMLNWCYGTEPDADSIRKVKEQNMRQIVCPGTSSWYALMEDLSVSVPNITKMAKYGYENGVLGLLNTNWGDYGHPAHFECALFGTTLGACLSWNIGTELNVSLEENISKTIYGTECNIIPIINDLATVRHSASWLEFFEWEKTRDSESFKSDKDIIKNNIIRCEEIIKTLENLTSSKDVLKSIINASKGMKLLCEAALLIKCNGEVNSEWKEKIDNWFIDYKKYWLCSNKLSEIDVIKDFLQKI